MKFLAALFAVAVVLLAALLSFPSHASAGGRGVQFQAFAVPQCHAGVQVLGVPTCGVAGVHSVPFAAYGVHQQVFGVRAFGGHAQATFVPQVNVEVNQQQRRGLLSRMLNRGTNVRVRVR